MYRYLAVRKNTSADVHRSDMADVLERIGLAKRWDTADVALYASADTPVVGAGSAAVLIGHVFTRSGKPVAVDDLPASGRVSDLVQYLVAKCWGEYVLLHSSMDDGRLTVMRDPSGGADCVYAEDGRFITSDVTSASEAGLFARTVDWDFIGNGLVYPHHKSQRTGLVGLRQLLPGCQLQLDRSNPSVSVIWSPWTFVSPGQRYRDPRQAAADLEQVVRSTVRTWAETDGSLLLELSGGLDSSIVAACLQGAQAQVACCNLVTPVPGADERAYAASMAAVLGTELHVATLGFDDHYLDRSPPPQAVAPSTWFLQHASNELKETLGARLGVQSFFSGGGGDSVFSWIRTAAPAADAIRERGLLAGARSVTELAELHQCTVWKAGRLTARKLLAPPKPPRRPDLSFLLPGAAQEVLDPHPWFSAPADALPGDRERIFDLAGTQVFRDGLARGTKRRLRMPLLSQPVMETCLRVPTWMWIKDARDRAMARYAFAGVLPPEIFHRRSKGTFVNYSGAAYRRHKDRLRTYLLSGQLASRGLLDTAALAQFFDRELAPRDNAFMRVFELCAVENWVRHQG